MSIEKEFMKKMIVKYIEHHCVLAIRCKKRERKINRFLIYLTEDKGEAKLPFQCIAIYQTSNISNPFFLEQLIAVRSCSNG